MENIDEIDGIKVGDIVYRCCDYDIDRQEDVLIKDAEYEDEEYRIIGISKLAPFRIDSYMDIDAPGNKADRYKIVIKPNKPLSSPAITIPIMQKHKDDHNVFYVINGEPLQISRSGINETPFPRRGCFPSQVIVIGKKFAYEMKIKEESAYIKERQKYLKYLKDSIRDL